VLSDGRTVRHRRIWMCIAGITGPTAMRVPRDDITSTLSQRGIQVRKPARTLSTYWTRRHELVFQPSGASSLSGRKAEVRAQDPDHNMRLTIEVD